MTQFIRAQTVAGAGQDFDGLANAGLFTFDLGALPKSQSVICRQLGIYGATASAAYVVAYFLPPIGELGSRILVGAADMTAVAALDGGLAVTFCPGKVPRAKNGQLWSLAVYSDGLSASATATLAYDTGGGCG